MVGGEGGRRWLGVEGGGRSRGYCVGLVEKEPWLLLDLPREGPRPSIPTGSLVRVLG